MSGVMLLVMGVFVLGVLVFVIGSTVLAPFAWMFVYRYHEQQRAQQAHAARLLKAEVERERARLEQQAAAVAQPPTSEGDEDEADEDEEQLEGDLSRPVRDAADALIHLGFSRRQAEAAAQAAHAEVGDADPSRLVRRALALAGRTGEKRGK